MQILLHHTAAIGARELIGLRGQATLLREVLSTPACSTTRQDFRLDILALAVHTRSTSN
jgi:hypothetical protein